MRTSAPAALASAPRGKDSESGYRAGSGWSAHGPELVTRREHGDARPSRDGDFRLVDRGKQREIRGTEPFSRAERHVSTLEVLPCPAHVLTEPGRRAKLDRPLADLDVFLSDDRVGTRGELRAREDAGRGSGNERRRRRSRATFAEHRQPKRARTDERLRAERIAVHRAVRKRREIPGRTHGLGKNASEGARRVDTRSVSSLVARARRRARAS